MSESTAPSSPGPGQPAGSVSPAPGQPADSVSPASGEPVDSVSLSHAQVTESVERLVAGLIRTLGRGAQLAGNSLGITGAALVIGALFIQLAPGLQLNDVDYVTTVIAGGSFALAGPLIGAYGRSKAGDTTAKVLDSATKLSAQQEHYLKNPGA
jgi:hypothetical protein